MKEEEEEVYNNDHKNYGRSLGNLGKVFFWSLLFWITLALLFIFLSGCAGIRHQTGLQKTVNEPLHAESGGVGLTFWKIPVLGIGGWGLGQLGSPGMPSIIVHKYDYQAKPPALAPDTPALSPDTESNIGGEIVDYRTPKSAPKQIGPPPVNYKTVYESAWDDPTLIVFVNQSYRVIKIQIADEKEIKLGPYQSTANLHFAPGEYSIRKTVEKPTGMGTVFDWVTFFKVSVALNGRSQILYLYDN